MDSDSKKIAFISLGCDKNRVDTERMLGVLGGGNFVVSPEAEAEIIVVNTCAFIESARKEAIETILSVAEYKQRGTLKKLIVTGCLPQKHMAEIKDDLPEVDAFLGTGDYDKMAEVIATLYNKDGQIALCEGGDSVDFATRRLTTLGYAYQKIAEGCDNHCTYCTIPSIRGAYRSRPIDSLVKEAEFLANQGVKELILVAQDVTNYGIDLYGKLELPRLIKELSRTNIEKIRLLYCYPTLITDELIAEIKNNDKVLKYLDIPLQHVSDKILRLMGRRERGADIKNLIEKLRREVEGIVIRTTFMVGFPGEDEAEFARLVDFVSEMRLNNVGIFAYSDESTPSAKLPQKVGKREANRRVKALASAQRRVVDDFNKSMVGRVLDVFYEGIDYDRGLFFGRSFMSAPDIDPLVYFRADFVEAGSTVKVKITGAKGYDLLGKMIT